mgnify:FL=1
MTVSRLPAPVRGEAWSIRGARAALAVGSQVLPLRYDLKSAAKCDPFRSYNIIKAHRPTEMHPQKNFGGAWRFRAYVFYIRKYIRLRSVTAGW